MTSRTLKNFIGNFVAVGPNGRQYTFGMWQITPALRQIYSEALRTQINWVGKGRYENPVTGTVFISEDPEAP